MYTNSILPKIYIFLFLWIFAWSNIQAETGPTITCPPNITIDCQDLLNPFNDGNPFNPELGVATVSGCGETPFLSFTDEVIDNGCPKLIERTWTSSTCAPPPSCVQLIAIEDTEIPDYEAFDIVLDNCADEQNNLNEIDSAIDNMILTITDNCSDVVIPRHNYDPAEPFQINTECEDNIYFKKEIDWELEDECGNIHFERTRIFIKDITPPVITGEDFQLECQDPDKEQKILNWLESVQAYDECGEVVSLESSHNIDYFLQLFPGCSETTTIPVEFSAVDQCGNNSRNIFELSMSNNLPPELTCPLDITIDCQDLLNPFDDGTPFNPELGVATVSGCGNPPLPSFTDEVIDDGCPKIIERTWTSNTCSLTVSCTQLITITDTQLPILTVTDPIKIYKCSLDEQDLENLQLTLNLMALSAEDNCSDNILVDTDYDPNEPFLINPVCDGENASLFFKNVLWTLEDECGNVHQFFTTISLFDTTPPEIIGEPLEIECQAPNREQIILDWLNSVQAVDDCGEVLSFENDLNMEFLLGPLPSCGNSNAQFVTFTATDQCGNTSNRGIFVRIVDNLPPVLTCPPNTTLEFVDLQTTLALLEEWEDQLSVEDCTDDYFLYTHTSVYTIPGCPKLLEYTHIAQVLSCKAPVNCEAKLTFEDTTPPIIECPEPLITTCDDPDFSTKLDAFLQGVNAFDASTEIPGVELLVTNDYSFDGYDAPCGFVGAQVVTFIAIDHCGNTSTCTSKVVRNPVPPVFGCPPDLTVNCIEEVEPDDILEPLSPCGFGVEFIVSDPILVSGNGYCSGSIYHIVYTATDQCGASTSCTQQFTIQNESVQLVKVDPFLEDVENGENIQLQCYGLDENWNIPEFDETAFEAIADCGFEATVEYQFVDLGAADCVTDGYTHRYQYIWTAQDECGTTDQFSFVLELIDELPPVLIGVPSDMTLECSEPLPALPEVIAIDECLCAHITLSETELPTQTCTGNRTVVRTWVAVDHCGNTTEASQHIFIKDQTAPLISISPILDLNIENGHSISRGCSPEEYPNWLFDLDESSINIIELCAENTTVVFNMESDVSYTCATSGYLESYTPSWTVTDDCGNSSFFSFNVTVVDNTAPEFYGSPTLYLCNGFEEGNAASIDDCTNAEMWYEDVLVENCGSGVFTRIYNISDDCQNTTTAEQLVIDLSENPDLISLAAGLDLDDVIYQCELNSENYSGMSEDDVVPTIDCLTDLEITFSETLIPNSCDNGGSKLQLLWTATTPCGYVDYLEYFIDIVDNGAPYFPDFQPVVEMTCGEEMPAIYAEDDCNSITMDIIENEESGDCPGERIITRTITATDICGNATTVSQLIHVVDNEGPVFESGPSICEEEAGVPVLAFDQCTGNHIEATLLSEQNINQCNDYTVTEKTWVAEDDCGNITEFVQLIYPTDYSLQFEIVDGTLIDLIDTEASLISKSDTAAMQWVNELDQTSLIAFDPCGDPVIGEFSKSINYHETCVDGIGETLTLNWHFAEVCGTVYEYTLHFAIQYDIPPNIEIEESLDIYCTTELPELILNQTDGVEHTIEEQDQRDEFGDGIVIRLVTAMDQCGNINHATQTIHAFNTSDLACSINGDFSPPCNSSANLYTVEISGGTAPYTINWYVDGDNCTIEQIYENTAEIYVGFGLANLRAEVRDANGCVTECKAMISCEGTGHRAGETAQEAGIKEGIPELLVYPNPFMNQLTVELEDTENVGLEISMLNSLGVEVYRTNTETGKARLDLSALSSGIYYLLVEGKNFNKSVKVLKVD